MTLLAHLLARSEEAYAAASRRAAELAERLLAPAGPLPRAAVERLLARARRNGAWPRLPREQRALLVAAASAHARLYRSPMLLSALRRAWLAVELATTRGRAVLAALTHLLARSPGLPHRLLRRGLAALLALGVQLLNHPLLAGRPARTRPPSPGTAAGRKTSTPVQPAGG